MPVLRPYQGEAIRAITDSVFNRRGHTITVEVARQGGKNELSAQLELLLLTLAATRHEELVKCAPTFHPQLRISIRRLWRLVTGGGLTNLAAMEPSAIRVGKSRIFFLSAEPAANVVGHTASLLLEVDEAQSVDEEKFDREFRPMGATTHVTTVMYGTAWDDRTLLERTKRHNLELERRDGIRRHFEYDWQTVARYLPSYAEHVEAERLRLGETHPLFLTQYCLKTIAGGGRLFTAAHRAQLHGNHDRQRHPAPAHSYIAGLDLAGGDDLGGAGDLGLTDGASGTSVFPPFAPSDPSVSSVDNSLVTSAAGRPDRDSTVLTIGRLIYPPSTALVQEPTVEIVEHYAWTGAPHETLLPQIIDLLKSVWKVGRVAIDATGLGETAARLIAQALGAHRVQAVKFTAPSKSQLGFDLLASANGGRLKMYRADDSPEHREFSRRASSPAPTTALTPP